MRTHHVAIRRLLAPPPQAWLWPAWDVFLRPALPVSNGVCPGAGGRRHRYRVQLDLSQTVPLVGKRYHRGGARRDFHRDSGLHHGFHARRRLAAQGPGLCCSDTPDTARQRSPCIPFARDPQDNILLRRWIGCAGRIWRHEREIDSGLLPRKDDATPHQGKRRIFRLFTLCHGQRHLFEHFSFLSQNSAQAGKLRVSFLPELAHAYVPLEKQLWTSRPRSAGRI
jgi:hypothetical protein